MDFYAWLNLAFCSSIDYLCLKHSSIDFFAYGMDEGFYLLSTAFVHRFLHLRYGRVFLFIVHCMDEYASGKFAEGRLFFVLFFGRASFCLNCTSLRPENFLVLGF